MDSVKGLLRKKTAQKYAASFGKNAAFLNDVQSIQTLKYSGKAFRMAERFSV